VCSAASASQLHLLAGDHHRTAACAAAAALHLLRPIRPLPTAANARPPCTLPHSAADHGAADVRPLLRAARQGILAGVCILFSRVMPLDCADPSAHPLWQLAEKVGSGTGLVLLGQSAACRHERWREKIVWQFLQEHGPLG